MLKISVIIPLYNGADNIKKCLDRLDMQTFAQDFEVIIVNDGSTDNSVECVNNHINQLKRRDFFRIIDNKVNGRAGKARNTGINNAKGEYVVFIDQDDYPDIDFLKCLYDLTNNSQIDCTTCDIQDRDGSEYRRNKVSSNLSLSIEDTRYLMKEFGYTFAILIRKSLLNEYQIRYPETLMFEDTLFNFWLLSCAESVVSTDRVLYYRTDDEKSQTGSITKKKVEDRVKSTLYYLQKINECDKSLPYRDIIYEKAFFYIYLSCVWWMLTSKELYDKELLNFCISEGRKIEVDWNSVFVNRKEVSNNAKKVLKRIYKHPKSIGFYSKIIPFALRIKHMI